MKSPNFATLDFSFLVQKSGDQNILDLEATVKELADKVEKQEETIATLKDEIRAIKRHLQFEVNSTDSQVIEENRHLFCSNHSIQVYKNSWT